jgi:plasmid maintenance system antidote protein VapI
MTHSEIKAALTDRNLAEVARRLQVTRSYLQAIRSGRLALSERMRTRLTEYLQGARND